MTARSQPDGEVPRFRDDADGSTIPPRPPLGGEHGRLAEWFEGAIRTVEHEVKDIRDRLSRMEGAEEARSEWRQGIDHKLDALLARHADEPTAQRGWLTERTLPLILGAGLVVCVLVLVFAILFGPASTSKAIHDIRQDAARVPQTPAA